MVHHHPSLVKRSIDLVASALGLLILWPVFLLLTLAIILVDGRPVFFRQQRPGLHGRPFWMVKFRTMTVERLSAGAEMSDAARLTSLGRWLRRTSLDELPELWNVFRGDMSLVGPRPLLMDYLPLYSAEQARRHEVRPGITGWAQVNGRNALTWEEKFALDTWYVDNQSLRLDLRILGMTVISVLKQRGINAPGEATMSRFVGSEHPSRRP